MPDTLNKDQWLQRVLGTSFPERPRLELRKQITSAPIVRRFPKPDGGVKLGVERPRSKVTIAPPRERRKGEIDIANNGRVVSVAKTPEGRTLFTAPPPPVRELTFSGGGAKGMALAGAIQSLEENHVLDDVKVVTGASVGSMTAALVAVGISADDFTEVSNDANVTARIVEGTGGTKRGLLAAAIKNKWNSGDGSPLTGQGLEDAVCGVLDETLRKRIEGYLEKCRGDGVEPDGAVTSVAKQMSMLGVGPTFGHLRTLSKFIPQIKEVVITGTYTEEVGTTDAETMEAFKNGNDRGKLYIFDADHEPDMPVAKAVHASASFPAAFKPVDLVLSSGLKVRFIDGGVMNNTPTSSSVGNERKLDPVPDKRGMTFVFESEGERSLGDKLMRRPLKPGESDMLATGQLGKPAQGTKAKLVDWFVGSDHNASEYAKNRDASERPEEIVVVPLQLKYKAENKKGKLKTKKVDMRGGTLDFGLEDDAKLALQFATAEETTRQIRREKQPKTREFASDSQMFVSIGMDDLKAMSKNSYPGADAAVVFRERVAEMIDKVLEGIKEERKANELANKLAEPRPFNIADVLKSKNVSMALDELDTLAGKDVDFQGYVAREMNRGPLDSLLAAARKSGRKSEVMDASFAVADAIKAQAAARNVLTDYVYPKMKHENAKGAGMDTLLIMEGLLRAAQSPDDVNQALNIGIKHFKTKSDRSKPKRGHHQFAKDLETRLLTKSA